MAREGARAFNGEGTHRGKAQIAKASLGEAQVAFQGWNVGTCWGEEMGERKRKRSGKKGFGSFHAEEFELDPLFGGNR